MDPRGRFLLLALLAVITMAPPGCQRFRRTRADLQVTSDPSRALVYLVPIEENPDSVSLKRFKQPRKTPAIGKRKLRVIPGEYWLIVEKSGIRSDPFEIAVELGEANSEHVDFDVSD